ncbi:hypothetical protein RRG08_041882 [Elysia crispata]|uniref:Uncharacterized protein n=1 Tax=Elysia crispata TaxID=231223 RepID=A0AAE1CR08_9GAST|nr:hypothetical protein RRG08_041882 [Elysia crispata]
MMEIKMVIISNNTPRNSTPGRAGSGSRAHWPKSFERGRNHGDQGTPVAWPGLSADLTVTVEASLLLYAVRDSRSSRDKNSVSESATIMSKGLRS